MPLQVGSRLGPYELTAPIGAGGMGEVWRARDTRLARDVALKFLPEGLAQDPDRLARFRREAQLLAALNHPNIAAIYGLEEAEGVLFLVLELVPGEDLAARLKRGPLPLDDALAAAKQIAEALEEAHERGIVHRDLKPANVKVTPEGKVKVLDFGLAKAWTGDPASGTASSSDLSQSPTLAHGSSEAGLILGTAAYMSPEQARGKLVDKRSDVWSFGALVYELLTARRLFDGETVSDVLAAVLTRQPEWAALPAATPRSVRRLLERCLERDPKLRLRDIGEARIALSAGAQADDAGASAARGRRPALVAAGRRRVRGGPSRSSALVSRLRPPATPEAPVRKLDLTIAALEFSAFGRVPAAVAGRPLVALSRLRQACGSATSRSSTPASCPTRREPSTRAGRPTAVTSPTCSGAGSGRRPSRAASRPRWAPCRRTSTGSGGTAWSDDGQIVVAGSDTIGLLATPAKGGEARELVALDRAQRDGLPRGERAARRARVPLHRASPGGPRHDRALRARARAACCSGLPGESLRSPVVFADGSHPLPPRVHEPRHLGCRLLARPLDRLGRPVPRRPGRVRTERRARTAPSRSCVPRTRLPRSCG